MQLSTPVWYHLGTGGSFCTTNDLTIINTMHRTQLGSPLTSNEGSHHFIRRQRGGIHIKKSHRSLEEGSQPTRRMQFKLHSHLWECLLLNILHALLQGNELGSQVINHLPLILLIGLQEINLLGLTLHLPNKVVDHISQLINLHILRINAVVQLVNHPSYTISCFPPKLMCSSKRLMG